MASEMFPHLKIPLEVVVKATNNFHPDNKIGHGDFGPVYKGQLEWLGKSMKVAARRLDRRHGLGGKDFLTEVSVLSNLNHPNIVSIIGFCEEANGERIIVTTYEPNGSLVQFLASPDLTWTQRLKICVGAARVLTYLHSDCGVLHRFINSSTILVDESWEVKLSGFEISIKRSVQQMNQVFLCEPIGTIGYMDPATVKAGGVTSKSDIYAFGIVLFELLCGRKAYIQNEDYKFLDSLAKFHYKNKTLKDIIHPDLCNQMSPKSLLIYSEAAYACLEETPSHRPDMNYVYAELQKALEAQTRREMFISQAGKLEHLKIRLNDIKLATNEFSETIIRIEGHYTLYRAQLDHFNYQNSPYIDGENKGEASKSNSTVVIKRMGDVADREVNFFTEFEMLCSVKHNNIATMLGFSFEDDEMILVTDDVSNFYLHYYLGDNPAFDRRTLSWEKRLRICIDVAKALSYLHSEMEDKKIIIHRNVSCHNIGLDENWRAKIVDFGFSVFLPPDQVNEGILTKSYNFQRFYLDPKLTDPTMKIKRGSDVYSFGVLLFEFLCGRIANDPIFTNENKKGLAFVAKGQMEDKIDRIIMEEIREKDCIMYTGPNKDSIQIFIDIAKQCLAKSENQRPTMEDAVKELEKALAFQVSQEEADIEQVVQFTHENILEERIQDQNTGQHVDKLKKASEDRLTHEIFDKKFEHLRIGLGDITKATDNFSRKYMITNDHFCQLYRVPLKYFDKENPNNGAIKRISSGQGYDKARLYREIEMLNSVKHPNIVTLLGFCDEGSEMILLIDDVSNGPLGDYFENHSNKSHVFTWEERLKICIDVAHTLRYIHYEIEEGRMMLINRLISSRAIVLDKNWMPKIIDFGFAIFQHSIRDKEMLVFDPVGLFYSVSPETKKGLVNRKTDVYGFGVLLFQILCGRALDDPGFLNESSEGLAGVVRQCFGTGKLENIIDPAIKEEASENSFLLSRGPNKDSLDRFINIAYECIQENFRYRPTMKVVVEELEKSLFHQKNNKDNPIIPLEDIVKATENFKHCIGGGGFGKVYRGNLRDGDGFKTIVAKKLNKESDQGEKQFFNELEILLKYKHENVIGLVGYCNEKSEKIIVYEYASGGSLNRHLKDPSLTWIKRLNICIDVARALEFLHGGVGKQAKVIHRDIKTENILVNDDWKGKLADFGLSLISPLAHEGDHLVDYWCGTPGYVDPVYQSTRILTIKSDIYSFGVVLFEILCGRSTFAVNHDEGCYQGQYDKVVLKHVREQASPESLAAFQEIAYQCLQPKREKRPTMKEVLKELKNALEFQNMASTITKCASFKIPLEDVVKATNNFHHENIIKEDRYAQLYKGRLLQAGNLVNITARRFDHKHGPRDLEFWSEVSMLSDLKHTNLVSLIGFCNEKDEKIILCTYGVNGSLKGHLNSLDLTWEQRLKICIGAARALNYLRYDEGREPDYYIMHRIINSSTILLDENWEAKLSSFEYSVKQFYKDQFRMYEPIDVMGYMDPATEKTGFVSWKSDIYSFGVVLFEILCGREAYIHGEAHKFLAPWAKHHYEFETLQSIILPGLWNQMSPQSLLQLSRAAYSCLNEEPPQMYYIVGELEKALTLQNMASTITSCAPLQIPLEDVEEATNYFHRENIIAQDRFGQLYKGRLLRSGNMVNITARRLDRKNGLGDLEFWTEVTVLSDLKHTNLVSVIGFCESKDERIIVTMNEGVNGNLSWYLTSPNLTWTERLRICVGVARALSYLYHDEGHERDYRIIHRLITSFTIWFDENWEAKLSTFEFSVKQFFKDPVLLCKPVCPTWYMDPSVEKTGDVTHKSDIYSFGVVLFELLCGRVAYIENDANRFLAPLAKFHYENNTLQDIIPPSLWNQMSSESLVIYSKVAYSCLQEEPEHRPDVDYIVAELEKAFSLQLNSEVKSDQVEESNHASTTATQVNRLSGESSNMITTGEFEDSKIHNEEKTLPDQTDDSADQSGCCWPCGFRKVAKLKNSKR